MYGSISGVIVTAEGYRHGYILSRIPLPNPNPTHEHGAAQGKF